MRRVLVVGLISMFILVGCGEGDRGPISDVVSDAGGAVEDLEEAAEGAADELEEQLNGDESAAEPDATAPTSQETDDTDLTPWIVGLLVLLVILLMVWLISASNRRSRAAAGRRRQIDEVLLDADWLIDTASEPPSSVDAAGRARDIRMRGDRLVDSLRRVERESSSRVAQAAADLRNESVALAHAAIARLDAASREQYSPDLDRDLEMVLQRAASARDRFIQTT